MIDPDLASPPATSGGIGLPTAIALAIGVIGLGVLVVVTVPTRWAQPIGLATSIVLGGVLCIAGAAKLVDLDRWRSESSALGVPWWIAVGVPIAELGIGALLVVGVGWPVVPAAGSILLVAFSLVIIRELAGGRRPRCACFGGWSTAPLSGRAVVRNGVLIALGVVSWLR